MEFTLATTGKVAVHAKHFTAILCVLSFFALCFYGGEFIFRVRVFQSFICIAVMNVVI